MIQARLKTHYQKYFILKKSLLKLMLLHYWHRVFASLIMNCEYDRYNFGLHILFPSCYAYICYIIWKGDFAYGIKVISTLKYS